MALELQSNTNSLGRFRVVHKKLDGTEVDYGWASNIVTKAGQGWFKSHQSDLYLRLGKGTGEVSENDKNLFTRLTKENFTNSSVSYNSTVYNTLHTRINYELPENIMRKLQAKYNDVQVIPVCCGKYVYTNLKNVIITEMGLSNTGYFQYNYGTSNDPNYDKLLTHTLLKNSNNETIQVNILEGEILEIHYAFYGIVHDFEQMKTSLTMTYVDDLSKPDQTRTEEYDVFVEIKRPEFLEDNRYKDSIMECLENTSLYDVATRNSYVNGKIETWMTHNYSYFYSHISYGEAFYPKSSLNQPKARFQIPLLFVPDNFEVGPISDAQKKFKIADKLYFNYQARSSDHYFYNYNSHYHYYYYYNNIYNDPTKNAFWVNMTPEEHSKNFGKIYNTCLVMLPTYEENKEKYKKYNYYYSFNIEDSNTFNLKTINDNTDPYNGKRWFPKDNKYYTEVVKNIDNYLLHDLGETSSNAPFCCDYNDYYSKTSSSFKIGHNSFKISPYWGTTFKIPKNGIRMITCYAWYPSYFVGRDLESTPAWNYSGEVKPREYMMFITFVNKKDGTGLKHTDGYETSFEITWTNTDVDTANINIPDAKVSFKYPKMAKGETLFFDVTGADANTTTRSMTWITIANDTSEDQQPLTVDLDAKTIKANSIGTHTFKVFSKKTGCLDVPDTITIQVVDYLRFTDHPKWNNTKEWNTIVTNVTTEDIQVPNKHGALVAKSIRCVTDENNRKYYSDEDIDNAAKAEN